MTSGAVYSNFAGKEELFLAIADAQVESRVAEIEAVGDAAAGDGDAGTEAADQFRAFLEGDPQWPLLFYEFWSISVRDPDLQSELAARRDAIRDALAATLERVANAHGFELRFPAPALATAIAASLNGLAFERAADPEALPDEVFGEFIAAVLGCAIAAPSVP
jgi:AcrR family transcriptional regulator